MSDPFKSDDFKNRLGHERLSGRQIDELIGLTRGIVADGEINQLEAEFLQKWLAANADISRQPIVKTLYERINSVLSNGFLDDSEKSDLLATLNAFSNRDFELGETLKSTTLPLCSPAPTLIFSGRSYCFTGTFLYGDRKACEQATKIRGGFPGSLTAKTNVLVIGLYATESWKHSSFGNKILRAAEMRDKGHPINIVSEEHWTTHL